MPEEQQEIEEYEPDEEVEFQYDDIQEEYIEKDEPESNDSMLHRSSKIFNVMSRLSEQVADAQGTTVYFDNIKQSNIDVLQELNETDSTGASKSEKNPISKKIFTEEKTRVDGEFSSLRNEAATAQATTLR